MMKKKTSFLTKQLQLVNKNWGYPSPVDANKPLFNARIERFYEQKPSMWDESFVKQRCIILASEFFEYAKNTYQADNGKKYHERYSFKSKQPITMIAGIYDHNNFAMVTTARTQICGPFITGCRWSLNQANCAAGSFKTLPA